MGFPWVDSCPKTRHRIGAKSSRHDRLLHTICMTDCSTQFALAVWRIGLFSLLSSLSNVIWENSSFHFIALYCLLKDFLTRAVFEVWRCLVVSPGTSLGPNTIDAMCKRAVWCCALRLGSNLSKLKEILSNCMTRATSCHIIIESKSCSVCSISILMASCEPSAWKSLFIFCRKKLFLSYVSRTVTIIYSVRTFTSSCHECIR